MIAEKVSYGDVAAILLNVAIAIYALPRAWKACVSLLESWMEWELPTPGDSGVPEGATLSEIEAYVRRVEEDWDLHEKARKEIVWWRDPAARRDSWEPKHTEYVVVALHGWSASPRELNPLDEMVARHLKANLYRHRLHGHGLRDVEHSGREMLNAVPPTLLRDGVDALKTGIAIGSKVVFVGSSTGAAVETWLCGQEWAREHVAGVVFNSPAYALASNYDVNKRLFRYLPDWLAIEIAAVVLKKPWLPKYTMGMQPYNEEHRMYWTDHYPVAALAKALLPTLWAVEYRSSPRGVHDAIKVPMLVFGNPDDGVVSLKRTREIMVRMGWREQTNEEQEEAGFSSPLCLYTFDTYPHTHCTVCEVFNPWTLPIAAKVAGKFLDNHVLRDRPQ